MASRESSDTDEKETNHNCKSSKCWLYNCFSQTTISSDSEIDSDSEYVVVNHSVFKIPKHLEEGVINSNLNSSFGYANSNKSLVVQRGSEKSGYGKRNRKPSDRKLSDRRSIAHTTKADMDRIYQFIRMKTYEKMNPYEMSPNDFLNNISSVFVENLKDPVPKDPLQRPRIFNRYLRRKKKTEMQIIYERTKEQESRIRQATESKNGRYSGSQSLRKPTINPAVMSDINKTLGEESLGYKAAIEKEDSEKEYDEKVLIWKIVVANEEDDIKN